MKRKYRIYLSGAIFLILCAVALASFFVARHHTKPASAPVSHPFGKTYTVTVTNEGFSPAELTIHQYDTVTFISSADKDFWPASDPHPIHDIYPEFDPKLPILPTSSWSFQFDRIGTWKYHDHLFSTHRGVITVTDASGHASQIDCSGANANTPACWQEALNNTLTTKGLDAAFEEMANLYATNQDFAQNCHSFAHLLGQAAYQKFANHENFKLSPKSSYCGYGFYHGFMETLLQTTGSIEQAREFCAYAGKELQSQTSDAEGACYHGIGHGTVDGGDPNTWGNAQAMIDPGIKLCQSVAGNDTSTFGKLYRCVSGAYNAVEILARDPKYKLQSIQQNPFFLCPTQPEAFKEACYTNMLPALLTFTKNDFIKSAERVAAIPASQDPDNFIRTNAILGIFHEFIRENLKKPDYNVAAGVKLCRTLKEPLHASCIQGLSGGHMKYGEPQQEYVKAIAFCNSSLLKGEEQNSCYSYILPRLRIWYSPEKATEICDTVPQTYQRYCSRKS